MGIESVKLREYERNGFAVCSSLIAADSIAALNSAAMDLVRETTSVPDDSESSDPPLSMARVDDPHKKSLALLSLIKQTDVGRAAAMLTSSKMVQIWYSHVLWKPARTLESSNVGWHQDGQYADFFAGRFITAWIPLVEISKSRSPLLYILGSNKHGIVGGSGFSHTMSMPELKANILRRQPMNWEEIPVLCRSGSVSFHDSETIHGSYSNASERSRLSLTLHLRTEKNEYIGTEKSRLLECELTDERSCPVIYDSRQT